MRPFPLLLVLQMFPKLAALDTSPWDKTNKLIRHGDNDEQTRKKIMMRISRARNKQQQSTTDIDQPFFRFSTSTNRRLIDNTTSPTLSPTSSQFPSSVPTTQPTESQSPSLSPTTTAIPTTHPSSSSSPSENPSTSPSSSSPPSSSPSLNPSTSPTTSPTASPTASPQTPTSNPSSSPTQSPTNTNVTTPTTIPTAAPTTGPSSSPIQNPNPTSSPSKNPTATPTASPSASPTATPPMSLACAVKLFAPQVASDGIHPFVFDSQTDELVLNIFTCDHAAVTVTSEVRSPDCAALAQGQGVLVTDSSVGTCFDNTGTVQNCTNTNVNGAGLHKNLRAIVTVDPAAVTTGSLYSNSANNPNTGVISFCIRNKITGNDNVYVNRPWTLYFDWTSSSVQFNELEVKKILGFEIAFAQDKGPCPGKTALCGSISPAFGGIRKFSCFVECGPKSGGGANRRQLDEDGVEGILYLIVEADAQKTEATITNLVNAEMATAQSSFPAGLNVSNVTFWSFREVSLDEFYSLTAVTTGSATNRDRSFDLTLTPNLPDVVQFKSFGTFTLTGRDKENTAVPERTQNLVPDFFQDCVETSNCQKEVLLNSIFFEGSVNSVTGAGFAVLQQNNLGDASRNLLAEGLTDHRFLQDSSERRADIEFSVDIVTIVIDPENDGKEKSTSTSSSDNFFETTAGYIVIGVIGVCIIGGLLCMVKWFVDSNKKDLNHREGASQCSDDSARADGVISSLRLTQKKNHC